MTRYTLAYGALIAFVGAACAAEDGTSDEAFIKDETPATCSQAAEHMAACGLEGDVVQDDCDSKDAAEILEASCDELQDPGKGDHPFAALLCKIGLIRHCESPVCDSTVSYPEFSDTCEDYLAIEGCGACEYYRCREAQSESQCGEPGYYLDFGYRYCQRYAVTTEPRMSQRGQLWSARTRSCLISTLEESVPDQDSCSALVEAGYASHPGCYTDTGFCDLPLGDKLLVFNTIDIKDLDYGTIFKTAVDCAKEKLGK